MAVESVLIVLSILAAFGIDAAWDVRGDRRQEEALIGSLTAEFRVNRANLEQTILVSERKQRQIEALTAFSRQQLAVLPPDSAWRYLDATWNGYTNELAAGAVSSALAAGTISLIRDQQLRELVAGWPAAVENTRERGVVQVSQQTIVEEAVDRLAGSSGVVLNGLGGANAQTIELLQRVHADDQVMARAHRMHFLRGLYQSQLRQLLERLDTTLTRLEGVR